MTLPKPRDGDVVVAGELQWTYGGNSGLWRARDLLDPTGPVVRRCRWGSRKSDALWMRWLSGRSAE